MILTNAEGRKIEVMFYGDYECPEVDEAYYVDTEEDVTEEDIEYILGTYDSEIHEHLMERKVGYNEDWEMGA